MWKFNCQMLTPTPLKYGKMSLLFIFFGMANLRTSIPHLSGIFSYFTIFVGGGTPPQQPAFVVVFAVVGKPPLAVTPSSSLFSLLTRSMQKYASHHPSLYLYFTVQLKQNHPSPGLFLSVKTRY